MISGWSADHQLAWTGTWRSPLTSRPPREGACHGSSCDVSGQPVNQLSLWTHRGMKGAETQKGAPSSEPILWGCLKSICRHFPLFSKESSSPLGYLLWPSPSWPHLLPHHLLTVPEKPWCFHWSELNPSGSLWVWAPAGLPRGSGLGPAPVCAAVHAGRWRSCPQAGRKYTADAVSTQS